MRCQNNEGAQTSRGDSRTFSRIAPSRLHFPHRHTPKQVMASFTWDESTLSADCPTLESMAQRFEETAALMRQLDKSGFEVKGQNGNREIIHTNTKIFSSFGFILDKS